MVGAAVADDGEDDNVRIDSSVVNFLTLRPTPLLVRHGGSRSPSRVFTPKSRTLRRKRKSKCRDHLRIPPVVSCPDTPTFRTVFSHFPCHRVACPARSCVVGVCRGPQKVVFLARVTHFSVSLSRPMSFSSRSAARAFRSVSRRTPKSFAQQSASYSLLAARTAAVTANLPRKAAVQVRTLLSCPRKHV